MPHVWVTGSQAQEGVPGIPTAQKILHLQENEFMALYSLKMRHLLGITIPSMDNQIGL